MKHDGQRLPPGTVQRVWKDVESLQAFVYNSRHREFVRRRRQWFSAWQGPSYVLWWVVLGDRPTPHDGKQRLDLLAAHGPGADAFDFRVGFPPPVAVAAPVR